MCLFTSLNVSIQERNGITGVIKVEEKVKGYTHEHFSQKTIENVNKNMENGRNKKFVMQCEFLFLCEANYK